MLLFIGQICQSLYNILISSCYIRLILVLIWSKHRLPSNWSWSSWIHYMFAGPDSRAFHNERQQRDINSKCDSEHKIIYKLCKITIYTSCTIGTKILHHSLRHIWVLCDRKAIQIWSVYAMVWEGRGLRRSYFMLEGFGISPQAYFHWGATTMLPLSP